MSYAQISEHRRMLVDDRRNEAYARAIRAAVGPQSVVMDLGAGLGIHGLIAAAAGARKVYLVEPESVVLAAYEAARASGLLDRVVIVRDRIELARIPEKVDLIVSAFTGNLLFSEDLLASLYFARDRYLREGGAMVPDQAELWLAPCMAPALHAEYVSAWQRPLVGLDYGFAARCAANDIVWPTREQFASAVLLAQGGRVAHVDLRRDGTVECAGTVSMEVEAGGLCHGLAAWLRIKVGDEWLTTRPGSPPLHWSPALLPVDPPLPLQEGEAVTLSLRRPPYGEWTWSIEARAGARRHSTFLSQPESPSELARVAQSNAPGLGARGKILRRILDLLAQGRTVQECATALATEHAMTPAQAMLEVQAAAKRYGA